MSSPSDPTPTGERTQRVHWFAGRLGEVLDDLTGAEGDAPLALSVLSAEDTIETVAELDRGIARLVGLRASVLAHAEAVGVASSATPIAVSTSGWFRTATVAPGPVATRTVKDAVAMEERHRATGAALRAGRIDADQAHEIVRAVDQLPQDIDPELRVEAEAHLLHLAATHPSDELRRLGKHLHEVVDPDAAEARLGEQLSKEEAEAEKAASVWMRSDGEGKVRGGFVLSQLHADVFAAMLDRYANPTRHSSGGSDDPGPGVPRVIESRDQAWGRAFGELLESIPADLLPSQGGTTIATVVTMTLDQLLGGLGPALLDTGHQISAGEARRLAARHGVIPAVLGKGSTVLDLGRRSRLFSPAQRLALRVQHPTCTAEGCHIPAAWCQAHHKDGWHPKNTGRRPGRTDLRNGTLLCGRHHRLVDKPGYDTTYRPDGTTVITRIRR